MQCAIQENSPETVCVIDPRIRLTGGPDYCDIEITRVTPSDYGTWDCLVNEIEEVSSDQAQIALEVKIISSLILYMKHLKTKSN